MGKSRYFIPGGDDFIAGLLNSKAVWFFLTGISDSVRGGFYRMFAQNIMRIPIPEAASTQKESIAEIAQQCQALAEQRYQLQQNITRRIPDLCPPDREAKLTNKLKSWWELDFDTFQKEIKKAFKTSIPLAERNDWQDYLQSSRQQVAELARELSAREEALNRAVYAVFDLTPEEIGLLENGL